jgi:dienelactone hydrolase
VATTRDTLLVRVGAKSWVLAAVFGLTATATTAAASVGTAPGAAPPDEYGVGVIDTTYVDTSRPTAPFDGSPGAPSRTLPTAIYYPSLTQGSGGWGNDAVANAEPASALGPFPLLVFASGIGSNGPADFEEFEYYVKAGYVVAAPTFPITSQMDPAAANDVVNEPGDISFVLTQVLKDARTRGNALRGLVKRRQLGLIGRSLGGIAALGTIFNPQYRDPRFDAVVVMAGAPDLVPNDDVGQVRTPYLEFHGTADESTPYDAELAFWQKANPPKFFVTIPGADHDTPFFNQAGGDPTPLNQAVGTCGVTFFDVYLTKAARPSRITPACTVADTMSVMVQLRGGAQVRSVQRPTFDSTEDGLGTASTRSWW